MTRDLYKAFLIVVVPGLISACTDKPDVVTPPLPKSSLAEICAETVGPPRVIRISERISVAIGYDLANTILIRTSAGNVIVDAGLSPKSAAIMRQSLLAESPGPIRALILTHSHIDHVGGASVWASQDTEIWATAAFSEHFLKQYGLFQPIEKIRGARQFGSNVNPSDLPCTGIGPTPDIKAASRSGARLPNRTFSGHKSLTFGDVTLELFEAHGETHDQLFVWLPEDKALLAGDNIYRAFPNLYTIRGTSPRPVREWITSLDAMRRLQPEHLIPSHTKPLSGIAAIDEALTSYRDGIQWVYDSTVRGANAGKTVDQIVAEVKLPPQLARHPFLRETYGQIDWSVRGIYGYNLGWFDGRASDLYPLPRKEVARREIALMGGNVKMFADAKAALEKGEAQWAAHLTQKLIDAGDEEDGVAELLARALRQIGGSVDNSNGRAYLLESAVEIHQGTAQATMADPQEEILHQIPLTTFFEGLSVRLDPEKATGVHEAVAFSFADTGEMFFVTIRNGIAEVASGAPVPGTPKVLATLKTDARTWRRIALKKQTFVAAVADGEVEVDGSWVSFLKFMTNFATD